jgi:hypothetical protein
VQGRNSRISTQRANNFVSAISLNGNQGERTNSLRLLLRSKADGVADNRPVALQARETVLHSPPGNPQFPGEGSDGGSSVISKQSQQLAVNVIHGLKTSQCPTLVPQSSQNASQSHHSDHKYAEIDQFSGYLLARCPLKLLALQLPHEGGSWLTTSGSNESRSS